MSQPPPLDPSSLEPLRVESLPYGSRPLRPGILVAVGIVSIVLGSLSILTSGSGVMMSFMYRTFRMTGATATWTTNAPITYTPPTPVMMEPPARQVITASLNKLSRLSQSQQEMLDKLLAAAGDQMFPFAEASITEEKIAAGVSSSGQVPGPPGSDVRYFIIANGRIEVDADQASFSPARGDTVRVYREAAVAPVVPAIAPPTMPAFATTAPTSTRPFVLYGIGAGLNLLLAVYLLIIGIMVLIQSRRGRSLHLIYAVLKIPIAILAGIAYGMMMAEVMGGLMGTSTGMLMMMYSIQGLIACIYPIALLIVMNTRGVKEYYRSLT